MYTKPNLYKMRSLDMYSLQDTYNLRCRTASSAKQLPNTT